jgi:6-phosphogluconolactonase (cycloisomerase 2 family)
VASDPGGHFLYVANLVSGSISAFTIDSTSGSLRTIANYSAGANPISIAVDTAGKYVYVTNSGSRNVSALSIDSSTGALTQISGSPFAAGSTPVFVE